MFKRLLTGVVAIAVSAAFAPLSDASVLTFQQADYLSMSVIDSSHPINVITNGSTGVGGAFNPNPSFADGTPMTGVAGSTGLWPTAVFGQGVYVDFALDTPAKIIAAFGSTNLTGATLLAVTAYNDNDDTWFAGVNITTANDGFQLATVQVTAGNSVFVSLDLTGLDLSNVLSIGVSIDGILGGGSNPSPNDAFHMSFSPAVPEPGSIAIWGMLCLGMAGISRRRK